MSITITTWNVNSLKVRQPQVLDFLKETENSILYLQEHVVHFARMNQILVFVVNAGSIFLGFLKHEL